MRGVGRAAYGANEMALSYAHKLWLAADPVSIIRTDFRAWRDGRKRRRKLSRDRHLTCRQREDISTGLEDSVTGPVSMTAAASDKEAVCYESEMASVLEETGFEVEIDNPARKAAEREIPKGVEMTIADQTVRPRHAHRIVDVFRRAGIAIATKINARLRKNDTLYITVGAKGGPALVRPAIPTAAIWKSKPPASLFAKWRMKFASARRRPERG
jgi:hypothetical protein